jgi:uncharacterized protein DUF6364
MPNITLSVDEATLEAAREYAQRQGWSLNELVRKLLRRAIAPSSLTQLEGVFSKADELNCASDRPWSREDLYDRPVLR